MTRHLRPRWPWRPGRRGSSAPRRCGRRTRRPGRAWRSRGRRWPGWSCRAGWWRPEQSAPRRKRRGAGSEPVRRGRPRRAGASCDGRSPRGSSSPRRLRANGARCRRSPDQCSWCLSVSTTTPSRPSSLTRDVQITQCKSSPGHNTGHPDSQISCSAPGSYRRDPRRRRPTARRWPTTAAAPPPSWLRSPAERGGTNPRSASGW
jgi:hypothetical protein